MSADRRRWRAAGKMIERLMQEKPPEPANKLLRVTETQDAYATGKSIPTNGTEKYDGK